MAWEQDSFSKNLREGDVLGLVRNAGEFAGREVFGVDDFMRAFNKLGERDFMGALRSLGAGALELGTALVPTAAPLKAFRAGAALPAGNLSTNILRRLGAVDAGGQVLAGAVPKLRAMRAVDVGRLPASLGYGLAAPMFARPDVDAALAQRVLQASTADPTQDALQYLYRGMM